MNINVIIYFYPPFREWTLCQIAPNAPNAASMNHQTPTVSHGGIIIVIIILQKFESLYLICTIFSHTGMVDMNQSSREEGSAT